MQYVAWRNKSIHEYVVSFAELCVGEKKDGNFYTVFKLKVLQGVGYVA